MLLPPQIGLLSETEKTWFRGDVRGVEPTARLPSIRMGVRNENPQNNVVIQVDRQEEECKFKYFKSEDDAKAWRDAAAI